MILSVLTQLTVLIHNNLLTNMRFKACGSSSRSKTSCFTICNMACCYTPVDVVCKDKCSWTQIVKWILVIGIGALPLFFATNDALEDENNSREFIWMRALAVIMCIQEFIFIVDRILLYPILVAFTCCCHCGNDIPQDDSLNWSIVSPDYINYRQTYQAVNQLGSALRRNF